MPRYRFSHKLMIFNKHSNLVGDIEPILLTDVLYPVNKLPGDAFITQIVGHSYIKSNCKFAVIGNLPAGYILGDYFNIFCSKNYLLSVDCNRMIFITFKSCNLLWRK